MTFLGYVRGISSKTNQGRSKWSVTQKREYFFDLGSLYAEMGKLTDSRNARGIRYQLVDVLAFMVIAKLCGEDLPSVISSEGLPSTQRD